MRRRLLLLTAIAITAAAMAAAAPATAADVRLETGGGGGLTVTDNIDLAPDGAAEAALIATATATARLRAESARLRLAADEILSLDQVTGGRGFDVRNDFRGLAEAELIPDWLTFDARAAWTQALIDAAGPVSATPAAGRDSRTDVRTIALGPTLERRFGTWAEAALRYRHSRVFVADDAVGNSRTDLQGLSVASGARFTRFRLTGLAEREDSRTDGAGGDLERLTGVVSAEYGLSRRFALLASAGYERFDGATVSDEATGPVWSLGVRARPGPRTELELIYGRRYGDNTLTGALTYRLSPTITLRALAEEALETPQQALARDRVDLAVAPDGTLVNALTGLPVDPDDPGLGLEDQVARIRTYQAVLSGTRRLDSFSVRFIYQERDFGSTGDETALTAAGRWERRLAPDWVVGTDLSFRMTDTGGLGGRRSDTLTGRLRLDHALSEAASVSASYARADRRSDDPADTYTENAVVIGARIRF